MLNEILGSVVGGVGSSLQKAKGWWDGEAKNEKLDLPLDNEVVKKRQPGQPRQQGYFVGLPSYAKQVSKGALLFGVGVLGYFGISAVFGKQKPGQATSNKNIINENQLSPKTTSPTELSTVKLEEFDEVTDKFVLLSSLGTGRTLLSTSEIQKGR